MLKAIFRILLAIGSVFVFQTAFSQGHVLLKGLVTDSKGLPLSGATVTPVEGGNAVTTDVLGKYTINVNSNVKHLKITFIGMEAKVIPASREFQSVILTSSLTVLNDVVVVGYGTTKRSNINSSIASIGAAEIKDLPVAGADQAIQGKVAGVTVTNNTGQPGGGVSIRVRGISSVNGNEPLYVVDGVPILTSTSSIAQDQLGGVSGQTTQSVLATLNPSDIQSIDILKDASAQAIYGAMAGNGVVLITTKKGTQGIAGKMTYDVYEGVQEIAKRLPLMNLREYAEYFNSVVGEGTVSGLDTIPEFENPKLLGPGTDWQEAVFQRGNVQNHQLSFSGGQGKTNYYFSGNYYNQTGTVIGSSFNRYAFRSSIDQQVNSWLRAGVSTNLSKSHQQITLTDGQESVIALMMYNNPATPVKGFDGQYVSTTNISGVAFGQSQNPVALALLRDVKAEQSKAYGNMYVSADLLKDLNFRAQFNYDYQLTNNTAFQPYIMNESTDELVIGPSKMMVDKNNSFYWGLQTYMTYNHTFWEKHALNIVVGHEASQSKWNDSYISVSNLTNNIESISAGTINTSSSGGSSGTWALESYFGRLNYTFDDRYSISLSWRRDGSASFGPDKRWGSFYAASAGWTVTNEAFARKWNPAIINYLKLRVGAGSVGNSTTSGSSLYTTNIRLISTISGLMGSTVVPGVPANVGNPYLSWESIKTYNAGIDATFLDHKIDLTVDVYRKITTNMILSTTLPSFAGLDPNPPTYSYEEIEPPTTNAGKMTNTGIDISLITYNITTKDFSWKTNFVFSHFKNILNKLNSPAAALYGKSADFTPVTLTVSQAGQPVGSFYGFKTNGLYRTTDELAQGPVPMLAVSQSGTWLGDIRYKDLDGNDSITTADQTFIGSPIPKFTYGITNTFHYKDFDFSFFFTGVYGGKIMNYSRTLTESMSNVYLNQVKSVMNRYTATNTNGTLPRYNQWNNNNLKISDRWIESGSYFRLQNISIGYTLPTSLVSKAKIKKARIYASAQNVFTITPYSGYDPELGSFNNSVLTSNIDYGHYPNPRSFTIGANIEF